MLLCVELPNYLVNELNLGIVIGLRNLITNHK